MSTNKIIRTLLFVVDTAGDMIGGMLEGVDRAINEATQVMRGVALAHDNVEFHINALGFFGEKAEWLEPKPKNVADFSCDLVNRCCDMGCSDAKFSVACNELLEKLSDKAFMGDSANTLAPVVIMVVDHKLDDNDMNALKRLTATRATNALIAIGNENNVNTLMASFRNLWVFGPTSGVELLVYQINGLATWSAWTLF